MANSDKMIVFEEIFSKIFEYWFQKFHMVYNLDIYLIQGTPSGQATYVLLINRVLRDVADVTSVFSQLVRCALP